MSGLYLIARLAGQRLAIDAREIDSVIDIGVVVPAPGAPATIVGVAALRSRVITVVNTWAVLDLPSAEQSPRAVVTRVDGHDYAILFDRVEDIANLDLAPLTSGVALEDRWRGAAYGFVEHGGEPMLAISLAALVPSVAAAA